MSEPPLDLKGGDDEALPIFRPSKRQKTVRKRKASLSPPPSELGTMSPLPAKTAEDGTPSVTDILRHRKAIQQRRKGRATALKNSEERDLEPQELETTDLISRNKDTNTIASRFAPQTGQIKEVMDNHMTAYIESQLAKQRREASVNTARNPLRPTPTPSASHTLSAASPPEPSDNRLQSPSLSASSYSTSSRSASPEPTPPPSNFSSSIPLPRNPASLGKLQEIDLGPSARLRNEAATLLAARRLDASSDPTHQDLLRRDGKKPRRPRIRLDKKGRPLPPRPPKKPRRTSEDKARDRLVEEMLRENRMDIAAAEKRQAEGAGHGAKDRKAGEQGGDEAAITDADAKMAEEFRKEYLDAQAAGRRHPSGAQAAKAKEKEKEGERKEGGRGPKLGGSRSTRAVYHAREKEKEKEKERERERAKGK